MRYSIVGDTRGDRYHFTDHHYDGTITNGRLTGGLGLLTNGTYGSDSYSASPADWLGWRDDSQSEVMLQFELDHMRNISTITIHCNNQFSNAVKVSPLSNCPACVCVSCTGSGRQCVISVVLFSGVDGLKF